MSIYPAVFLLSAASIAFEILLARAFSISQWNHLSFMVISMALFGFAASGTILSLRVTMRDSHRQALEAGNRVSLLVLFYSVSVAASFLVVIHMPLDYMKLPLQPSQGLYLMTAFLLLAVPFFLAGVVLSYAYMLIPENTGRIYFFSMSGSAAGALAPLGLLPLMDVGSLVALTALLPLAALVPYPWKKEHCLKKLPYLSIGVTVFTSVLVMLICKPGLFQVTPSPYKSLSQLLLFPEVAATHEHSSLRGHVDTVPGSPFIRFAPGLSLKYEGSLPMQSAAFRDGDNRLVLYPSHLSPSYAFSQHTLAYAGYLLPDKRDRILIVQNGGGSAIACARSAGYGSIQVLEKNPYFSQILKHHYDLPVFSQNPRRYLENSPDRFDIIHIESWGASLPGASALTHDDSMTIDALEHYLSHMTKGGVVIVSRRLLLPPSNLLRLCGSAYQALTAIGIKSPQKHITIIRNWDTFSMLISMQPVSNMSPLQAYTQRLNFDIVWPQTLQGQGLNHFNTFEKPFHHLNVKALLDTYRSGTPHLFYNRYPLDVSPQTDNRPFPDKFFKWRKAKEIHTMTGGRLYTLLLSGEFVVLLVLFETLLTALCLLFLPTFSATARLEKIGFNRAVYFLSAGAGFILVEIYFINQLTRVFGDPVVSLAAVLASVLVFSGAGGLISHHLRSRHIKQMTLVLGAVLLFIGLTADLTLDRIIQLASPYRQIGSIVMLIPAGVLMGIPFPLGMRVSLKLPRQRAYAWAVNGCASVVASVAATQMAISAGIKTILWCAIAAYGLTWLTAESGNE